MKQTHIKTWRTRLLATGTAFAIAGASLSSIDASAATIESTDTAATDETDREDTALPAVVLGAYAVVFLSGIVYGMVKGDVFDGLDSSQPLTVLSTSLADDPTLDLEDATVVVEFTDPATGLTFNPYDSITVSD